MAMPLMVGDHVEACAAGPGRRMPFPAGPINSG